MCSSLRQVPEFEEVHALEHTPHPIEYQMYYSS